MLKYDLIEKSTPAHALLVVLVKKPNNEGLRLILIIYIILIMAVTPIQTCLEDVLLL